MPRSITASASHNQKPQNSLCNSQLATLAHRPNWSTQKPAKFTHNPDADLTQTPKDHKFKGNQDKNKSNSNPNHEIIPLLTHINQEPTSKAKTKPQKPNNNQSNLLSVFCNLTVKKQNLGGYEKRGSRSNELIEVI